MLLDGKPVPNSNEIFYLLRLKSDFLINDWTFSHPANEHWLFNFIFGFGGAVLPLELLGWLGRITFWIATLAAIFRLSKIWEIPAWAATLSLLVWLALGQTVANDEWIFGGFEAKVVSYLCLIAALYGFTEKKVILPAILLGLTFSFHPAIGLWATPAVFGMLLYYENKKANLVKVFLITAIASLPGLVPLISEQVTTSPGSYDDWKYVILLLQAHHMDPFTFSRRVFPLLLGMLFFNVYCAWKTSDTRSPLRALAVFQIVIGIWFFLGVFLRYFELYPLLRLMPMRLFPVIVFLFFFFSVSRVLLTAKSISFRFVTVGIVISAFLLLNPYELINKQVSSTINAWNRQQSDLREISLWIDQNTPKDSLIIMPPQARESPYYSNRASIVSAYIRYDRLGEWRERMNDLAPKYENEEGQDIPSKREVAFNKLPQESIESIQQKYGGDYLVSRKDYSYEIVFSTNTYRVYKLRKEQE